MISKNMSYNLEFLKRFTLMLNDEQIARLLSAKILVFGVGGVGGALCHFLVRSGIHNLDIVDFDVIDITNINRQLVSNINNVGKLKVEELKKQLLEINPNLKINAIDMKFSDENKHLIDFNQYDYIIDCIDDVKAKKLIIDICNEKNINLLCAMGAGNRYNENPKFEIEKIEKTTYDPLAKIIRKHCQEKRIKNLKVCYTKQQAHKFDNKIIASVAYYPINMATVMCSEVINTILGV